MPSEGQLLPVQPGMESLYCENAIEISAAAGAHDSLYIRKQSNVVWYTIMTNEKTIIENEFYKVDIAAADTSKHIKNATDTAYIVSIVAASLEVAGAAIFMISPLGIFFLLAGIALGINALIRLRKNREKHRSEFFAWFAVVFGIAALCSLVIIAIISFNNFSLGTFNLFGG